jgi:N-glycosylase/DNA lyase
MEFTVPLSSPFSLEDTLESGQLFRWERKGDLWVGVVASSVLKIRQEGDLLHCTSGSDRLDSSFVARYFRLDLDLDHILASVSKDDVITRAVERYYGLRIVSQEPWECLASFALATNANIPRIKKMVASVCAKYGAQFGFEGDIFASFPTPEALAKATEVDLASCGLGYRAPFLKRIAAATAEGKVDLSQLTDLGYAEARKLLLTKLPGQKTLPGVGPKVADCVLLYSCGKDEAFPIDVWIARVLAQAYPQVLGPALKRKLATDRKAKLAYSDYERISEKVRSYFGSFAGYAQQYLYMAAREESR